MLTCCAARRGARALSTKTTHFGFETVDEAAKKSLVGDVFKRVAEKCVFARGRRRHAPACARAPSRPPPFPARAPGTTS